MTQQPPPRRARHLVDPTVPRRRATAEDIARLERVQRIVMSVLVGTTVFHLALGLVIGAVLIDPSEEVARIGLCVVGGASGVAGVAAVRAIHRRSMASGWLLLGVVPMVAGLVLILG